MEIITNNNATFRWPVSDTGYESTEEILTLTFYNAYGEYHDSRGNHVQLTRQGKPADESKTNFLFMLNTLCKEARKQQFYWFIVDGKISISSNRQRLLLQASIRRIIDAFWLTPKFTATATVTEPFAFTAAAITPLNTYPIPNF
jgi:hypothetical protein